MKRLKRATDLSERRKELKILKDIHTRMQSTFDILYYGDTDEAWGNFNRGGSIYVFTTKGGTNGYRVFFDTANTELIFQQLEAGFYDSKGNLWFDDPVDVAVDVGNPEAWFRLVKNWVDECEAENPEFTEYED